MGRELRRVPMDFNWPLHKVWDGYLSPKRKPCPLAGVDCFNGETAASKWLMSVSRLLAMVGEEALESHNAERHAANGRIYPHPYLEEWTTAPRQEVPDDVHEKIRQLDSMPEKMAALNTWVRRNPRRLLPLTDELANLVQTIAGRELSAFSNGGYDIYRALVKLGGGGESWGTCTVCKGHGIHPDEIAASEAWEPTEPPSGEGFQLWETTSEGSPITPVFATLDELCEYAAENCSTFGSFKATSEEWRKMLDDGFVCARQGNAVFI